MKAKGRGLLVGLMVFILIVMTACSGSNSDVSNTNGENQETNVTFLVGNGVVLDGLEAIATDMKEKHNITTTFEVRPGGAEGDNIVKTRLATGEMTDLVLYNSGSLFKALNPKEYFVDLSGEAFIDRVDDSFKEVVSVDDAVYGVPGAASYAGGWLYNKKVYEELGLEVPTTWDQLMENNQKIKDAGKVPVVASYKDTWTSQLILLSDFYNINSTMPDFAEKYTNNEAKYADTPIALRGFEKIQELQKAEFYNKEETATSYETGLDMLVNGEAAHFPIVTTLLATLNDKYPDKMDDIGFFGQPGDDPNNHGMTFWMPEGIYINKDSENADAAKKWVEYFLSDKGLQTYMSVMKADGPYVLKDVELPEDSYEAVKDMQPYFDAGKVSPALEFLSPLKGPNLEQITVEVGLDMISAKEGADKYDRDVVRQAKQLGLEGW